MSLQNGISPEYIFVKSSWELNLLVRDALNPRITRRREQPLIWLPCQHVASHADSGNHQRGFSHGGVRQSFEVHILASGTIIHQLRPHPRRGAHNEPSYLLAQLFLPREMSKKLGECVDPTEPDPSLHHALPYNVFFSIEKISQLIPPVENLSQSSNAHQQLLHSENRLKAHEEDVMDS